MTADGRLLDLVRTKIADLQVPACIKDCELRYVAVNAAYARLFGRAITSFTGLPSEMIRPGQAGRQDCERRALVFNEECLFALPGREADGEPGMSVERFITEDDGLYLFERVMPGAEDAGSAPLGRSVLDTVAKAAGRVGDAMFAEVLEEVPAPIYVRDDAHGMVFANRAFRELSGLSIERLLACTEQQAFGASGEGPHQRNAEVLRTGRTTESEEIFPAPGGRSVPVISRRSRIVGPDGRNYVLGTLTDISALKSREARLIEAKRQARELQTRLESLLQSLPVGILILDRGLRIEYANGALFEMAGLDAGLEVLGWSFRDFIAYNHRRSVNDRTTEDVEQLFTERLRQLSEQSEPQSWYWKGASGTVLAASACKLDTGQYLVAYSDVSALRQREEESELFRSTIEQIPVPVFIRDAHHELVFVNKAYEDLLGGSRERLLGQTQKEMFPERSEKFVEETSEVLAGGVALEKTENFQVAGKSLSVITRLGRVLTSNDRRYMVGSITDVSALKERQRELVATQQQLEALYSDLYMAFSALPVGVMVVNRQLVIEFANEKCAEIWSFASKQVLEGMPFRQFWEDNTTRGWGPWDDFETAWKRRCDTLAALEGTITDEMLFNDGKYLLRSSSRLNDDKVLLTYADLTDMRAKDQEISEARVQLERIGRILQDSVQAMAQGLLVVDDGRIVQSNDMAGRILGVPADVLQPGSSWQQAYALCSARGDFGDDPQAVLADWRARLSQSRGIAVTFLTANGTWVQMELTASGANVWMVLLTDITEQKKREEELERLLHLAKAADRTKSDFIANMSHEFRTPMNGVLGMAELLSRSDLDTRQKTFVDIIVKSGNALLTIINDILDFSRIDAGEMTLRRTNFDPVEAIEDVASLLSASAAEKNIELILSTPVGGRRLMSGDAGRFRQIATNLIGNAIKFTDRGHVRVVLESMPLGPDEDELTLIVEDTGFGIPAENIDAIFDKFSKIGITASNCDGPGLGLAITAGLVTLFDGKISVDSAPGRGSCFTVRLRLQAAQDRREQAPLPMMVAGARVMIVDDNPASGSAIAAQLSGFGFEAVTVEDGESALALLAMAAEEGVQIDAVVIDDDMPDLAGIDLVRLMRGDPKNDGIGVIMLTAMTVDGDELPFDGLNVQAHLMKPARAVSLRARLIDVIRGLRRNADRASKVAELPAIPLPCEPEAGEVAADTPSHLVDVLVADDNAINRIVFTQILEALGYSFEIVENGELAVAAWQSFNPGMILMDIDMPVMNGLDATAAIRGIEAAEGRPRVAIVAVTAHAEESDRQACLAAGMDDHLAKPVSPDMVQRKIDMWLHDQNNCEPRQAGG
ncbi:PAS-domain containing protein [Rhizobium halophytocola]|uniref:histidine kinase n=1 Tax=Rhizobium halophytocola TaxID=735519 RepID=A0ABS4DSE0_9HYPH|nr:PAS-domain containing protein [Rhizobium halophytocola]MBP1848613.1 PAS domain S-box-containing protein [Rhizobium halophytocola]